MVCDVSTWPPVSALFRPISTFQPHLQHFPAKLIIQSLSIAFPSSIVMQLLTFKAIIRPIGLSLGASSGILSISGTFFAYFGCFPAKILTGSIGNILPSELILILHSLGLVSAVLWSTSTVSGIFWRIIGIFWQISGIFWRISGIFWHECATKNVLYYLVI